MKTINLPPYAPTLIESTRAIGYSLEAAVADIIDNSIAVGARNVDLFFFPIDGAYIAILDDGAGMDIDELNCAMQYGSKNPNADRDEKDLGRFGLGLKTASLSQCRCLSVISKQGNRIEGRRWDLDHVTQQPHIVSKGAQTNFASFAEYIDAEWASNEAQFNERYFQSTAALLLLFQYLEKQIPKQEWYEGGYRANIIYYSVALFHRLIKAQFPGADLDLMLIWNKQCLPEQVENVLMALAERVLKKLTDPSRKVANVTQWCKRLECWNDIKTITFTLPSSLDTCLITVDEEKAAQRSARKAQKETNDINAQVEVVNYSADIWKALSKFAVAKHWVGPPDVTALSIACQMPLKIPTTAQSKRLIALLNKAIEEGFNVNY